MILTTVAWIVGAAGILFAIWEVARRIRGGTAHIRRCTGAFEPSPPAGQPANRPAVAPQGGAP